MKIAINKCYGGFSISPACAKILKAKGVKVTMKGENYPDGSGPSISEDVHTDNEMFGITTDDWQDYNKHRCDTRLIDAIEEIGCEKASGKLAKIAIVEIPYGVAWELDEYDGIETVREKSRSW